MGIGLVTGPVMRSAETNSGTDSPLPFATESPPATQPPAARPRATRPSTADFTAIADACALPTSASLQRLAPGGDNKAWRTGTDDWSCYRIGREESLPGTPGHRQLRRVLISLSIASATRSHSATEQAHKTFTAQRDRDHAAWGRRYRVLHIGDDAYSGYSEIGGDGKAETTVRLRNIIFTVTYTGTTWPPRLLAPHTPMPEHTARKGAEILAREIARTVITCVACTSRDAPTTPAAPTTTAMLPGTIPAMETRPSDRATDG
ncbi:hypothetical protein [Actinomadura sp. 7K507]|uniref:hypothetical protein n=1 Tax=Actinomadura sp. 7K507 TaxID=2530365 RepID=UPI00104ADD1C|nr:hypothetical protein [Actinomadura sp. 7K507]TDC79751.1 hypothetical protein E1285_35695 [Actinomadura sp. 7K507]